MDYSSACCCAVDGASHARIQCCGAAAADGKRLLHRKLAAAGRRVAAGDKTFRRGRCGGATPPAAATHRHRRLRRLDRPQLAAARWCGNSGAAQAHPARAPVLVAHTDVPENDFTVLFQTLENDPDTYLRRDGRASPRRSGGRSTHDLAVQQRESGLDVLGDSVAEPRSGADSRPRAGGLQQRRGRPRCLRQAGGS